MKYIELNDNKQAIVDDEDHPYLSRFRVIYTNKEVFVTLLRGRMRYVSIPLWAFIVTPVGGCVLSFKNKNPLDFRKENLYWIRNPEKVHRTTKRMTNAGVKVTSKYKGVCKKHGNRIKIWHAQIRKDGKAYSLGYYKTQKEAALAYNEKALELYGEYAYQNKI